ncbi:MAG: DUF1538 family protein [Candidatus Latescibacteria bacterium]|nr:DUF1538 family protein [Candidatus Latescibacterota bacterium]
MTWRSFLWLVFSEVLKAVLPICLLLFLVKAVLLGIQTGSVTGIIGGMTGTFFIIIGLILIIFGLSIFLKGLEHSLLPLAENVGSTLPQKARLWLIILFSLLLGGLGTIAEPDLKVYVDKAIDLLGGQVSKEALMYIVAIGAAVGLTIGILRIALQIRPAYIFLPIIFVACILTFFCPKPLNLAAWDFAPVVSGSVTVPLFLALGLGLAAIMGGDNHKMAGFGLVTLASMGPVIAVLLYGAIALHDLPPPQTASLSSTGEAAVIKRENGRIPHSPVLPLSHSIFLGETAAQQPGMETTQTSATEEPTHRSLLSEFVEIAGHVLSVVIPVYIFLIAFQRLVLRGPVHHMPAILTGLGVIVLGLVCFFKGLDTGFFPLVEGVGQILPRAVPVAWIDIGLCVILGLVVTFAEPSVIVFAKQIEEATVGAIHRQFLFVALGIGVAFGFGLGILRIYLDIPLPYFLLPILVVEAILTVFTAERYALIAWDTLGVTSGAITVPFFLAMGLGIASVVSKEARIAGLGLVTMASVGPVMSVLIVGLIAGRHR